MASPNDDIFSANEPRSLSPLNIFFTNDVIPFIISAPHSIKIASAKYFAPCIDSGFISFTPLINPSRLVMKSVRCCPIAGSPDITPSASPPIILPTNSPRP